MLHGGRVDQPVGGVARERRRERHRGRGDRGRHPERLQTIGQLLQKSESELGAIPNFGQKSIEEVIENLQNRGYDLRQD